MKLSEIIWIELITFSIILNNVVLISNPIFTELIKSIILFATLLVGILGSYSVLNFNKENMGKTK